MRKLIPTNCHARHSSLGRPFQDGIHRKILEWISGNNRPILFLSGVSGAGKSSVLEGYVLPMLSQAEWRVQGIRTFADPLTPFNQALSAPRRQGKSLLIVFDQFEEFTILEDQSRSEERQGLLAAVRALRQDPRSNVFLLFSYRSDYQSAIEELQLEDLMPRLTWMEVAPFGRSAAEAFLKSAPEKPAPELVARLLSGADALDETPGLYRPIILNILGLMFERYSSEFTGKPERQIQNYLESAIHLNAIRDVAPYVIKEMITSTGSKIPKPVGTLKSNWP